MSVSKNKRRTTDHTHQYHLAVAMFPQLTVVSALLCLASSAPAPREGDVPAPPPVEDGEARMARYLVHQVL